MSILSTTNCQISQRRNVNGYEYHLFEYFFKCGIFLIVPIWFSTLSKLLKSFPNGEIVYIVLESVEAVKLDLMRFANVPDGPKSI